MTIGCGLIHHCHVYKSHNLVQIVDKEAVEEVRTRREIPEIRPGYIVQLKVVTTFELVPDCLFFFFENEIKISYNLGRLILS